MKRLSRLFGALAALAVVAAIVTGSALAAGNAAAKATGDIWFVNPYSGNAPAHFVFNALGGSTVKGNVSYDDPSGSYTGKITAVTVAGEQATFTAQVTSSTLPGVSAGSRYTWTVTDVGEPGAGNDYFVGVGDGFTTPPLTVTAGNIQVQS
jgi:hypothetical protein